MTEKHWLVGERVAHVREMTDEEYKQEGWEFDRHGRSIVIEFESGVKVYGSQDPEGNGPGCLFGTSADGVQIYI